MKFSNIRRSWWPGMVVLVVLSAVMAWIVNSARPSPLLWWADYKAQTVEAVRKSGLQTLTPAQAMDALKRGEFLVVDARDPDEFAQGHVPGAVNVSSEAVLTGMEDASRLPKDRDLLLYCSNLACPKSKDLAKGLADMGYTRLSVMPEGMEGWLAAGGPVEENK